VGGRQDAAGRKSSVKFKVLREDSKEQRAKIGLQTTDYKTTDFRKTVGSWQ